MKRSDITVVVTCSGRLLVRLVIVGTKFRLIRLREWDFQTAVAAGLLFSMNPPHMLIEVVTTHKAFATLSADEPFLMCVDSYMSLQLIGPGKTFATVQPMTLKWSFTSVPPEMCTKMGSFGIHLGAVWVVTRMLLLSR